MLGNFSCFCCRLLTSFKINFLENSFRNTIRVSNSLDPDQAQHYVGPDLSPDCLQMLSADDTSRQRNKVYQSAFGSLQRHAPNWFLISVSFTKDWVITYHMAIQ